MKRHYLYNSDGTLQSLVEFDITWRIKMDNKKNKNEQITEMIDLIKGSMPSQEYKGFLKGNIIKYITRSEYKGNELLDSRKALWYLEKLVEFLDDNDTERLSKLSECLDEEDK